MTNTNNFFDVTRFNTKFGVPLLQKPGFLSELHPEAQTFRENFLQEELDEFKDACADKNLLLAFDSLIDIVYIAMGTANMMGCTPQMWQDLFTAVQNANMSKVRATVEDAKTSKRKTALDILKPASWISPDVAQQQIIEKYSE